MEEKRAEWGEVAKRVFALLAAIPKEGASGTVECPTCGTEARWQRDPGNGHVVAACSTEGCASFRQ